MTDTLPTTAASDGLSRFEGAYRDQQRARRVRTVGYGSLFLVALIGSAVVGEFNLQRLLHGLPRMWAYIEGTLPTLRADRLGADLAEWYWGLWLWLRLLGDTIIMGFVGTALGAGAALLLCFSASRNLMRHTGLYFVSRRLLEVARTVPELVYALIFVYAFGIGPLAGVLAIAVHTTGALGKLFSEVNENVDARPLEGVRAAGGTWAQTMRLAVLPQVLPNFASYTLLRFEINVRGASVLGFVGAGGIGEELYLAVRQFEYTDINAILLLILIMVAIIDMTCEGIRHRLIGHDSLKLG